MKIAVIIPCYKVVKHILPLIDKVPDYITGIYCIDDACPNKTGDLILEKCKDSRVKILRNSKNLGVGGAVMTGYAAAQKDGFDIAVKIDGDGQMDPTIINRFIEPIMSGEADYTKGNRFYTIDGVRQMPAARLFGNAILSFLAKFSTGYWSIFDPTNGYTAIQLSIISHLSLPKVSRRYFFESDLLFRLNIARCVVQDIPMISKYENEESGLRILKIIFPFFVGHLKNFMKRIIYSYYIRDFSLASVEFIVGCTLAVSGGYFGITKWISAIESGAPATAGTVMIAALQLIVSLQLILSAMNYDVNSVPKKPLHKLLAKSDQYGK